MFIGQISWKIVKNFNVSLTVRRAYIFLTNRRRRGANEVTGYNNGTRSHESWL